MEIEKLNDPLNLSYLDFRIQSINKGGYAIILPYKDARADMNILDEVCGPLNWKRAHTKDNHNCIISIYNKEIGEWISKEDTGSESNTEKAKGLASDSFKRAGFNWGIGRELYDYPLIQVKLNADEFEITEYNGMKKAKATWNLKLKEWAWAKQTSSIGDLTYLAAKDQNNKTRFTFGEYIKENHLDKTI